MNAPRVISFHEQVLEDCAELRELAEWFEKRSAADTNGKWLRQVADRYEVTWSAYNTASRRLMEMEPTQDAAHGGRDDGR